MYKHLLVATDGSKLSMKAVAHAIGLAQALGAKVTAFYAAPDYPLPMYADGVVYEPVSKKEYTTLMAKEAQKVLDAVASKAGAAGVECATVHAIAAAPWEANIYSWIVAANESTIKSEPDLIVRILRGMAKASDFTATEPKAAAQVWREAYPDSINAQLDRRKGFENDVRSIKAQLYDMGLELDSVPKPPARVWGGQSEANWSFLQDYLQRTGQITKTDKPATFFTDELTARANTYDKRAIGAQAKAYKTEF